MSSSITVVRYEARPEAVAENRRLVEAVLAELAERREERVRYAVLLLDDGVTFLHLLRSEGDENPLPQLDAFRRFQAGQADRAVTGTLTRSGATLVGAHRLFDRSVASPGPVTEE
ncbi:hypothetical protein AB0J86_32740 [Micromonospora sp. NPDC049559]|uniref:hypothetical protein n=1 Tax=Micromonospora sp. NPDC049559 TaxID=3155923 RepID=UPI00342E0581